MKSLNNKKAVQGIPMLKKKSLEQEIAELNESLRLKSEQKDDRLRSIQLERELLKISLREELKDNEEYQRDLRIVLNDEIDLMGEEIKQCIEDQECLVQSINLKLKLGIWIDVQALRDELAELDLMEHHQKEWEALIKEIKASQGA